MTWLLTKYLLTAAVIVLISEIAKRSDKLGGFIAALPLVTILTLIWMHIERQSVERIANHASYTLWYVLPTLPMFVLLPALLSRYGFWIALFASAVFAIISFGLFAYVMRRFGVELLP